MDTLRTFNENIHHHLDECHHLKRLEQIEQLGCQFAFYYHRGDIRLLRANAERFPSASVIKVPILLAWLELERAGLVDRNEICDLDSLLQVEGAGFSYIMAARRLPYHDLLLLMIAVSDNLATNLVIERAGMERLNTVFRQLGLTLTELQRSMMDFEARQQGRDNWIGVQDAIRLYDLIFALAPADRAFVDKLLLANVDEAMLKRNLPHDSLDFYHKSGSIPGVKHDWGYTRSAEMFFFTAQVSEERPIIDLFGELGLCLPDPV